MTARPYVAGYAQDPYPATNLGTGLPPARGAQSLGAQDADDGQHRPPAVDALCLRKPLQRLGVGAQPQRVEAVVACESRGQHVAGLHLFECHMAHLQFRV
jgi:hypothetical protein